MNAAAFLNIIDEGMSYELIDGVVVVSPSPSPLHQKVMFAIARLLADYLDRHPVGEIFVETDVHIGSTSDGRDIVYRPEIAFIRSERISHAVIPDEKLIGPPDMVVEVISRGSRQFDSRTNKEDYERFGVSEYWLIDPDRNCMTFYRRSQGCFEEVALSTGGTFASSAVPGFVLDSARVRKTFQSR